MRLGVADAIADVVSTGTTLRNAGLEIFGEPLLTSQAVLIQRQRRRAEPARRAARAPAAGRDHRPPVRADGLRHPATSWSSRRSRSRRASSRRPCRRCTSKGWSAVRSMVERKRDQRGHGRAVGARRPRHPRHRHPRVPAVNERRRREPIATARDRQRRVGGSCFGRLRGRRAADEALQRRRLLHRQGPDRARSSSAIVAGGLRHADPPAAARRRARRSALRSFLGAGARSRGTSWSTSSSRATVRFARLRAAGRRDPRDLRDPADGTRSRSRSRPWAACARCSRRPTRRSLTPCRAAAGRSPSSWWSRLSSPSP